MTKYNVLLIEPNNNTYSEDALEKALGGSETIFIFLMRYLRKREDIELDVFFKDSNNGNFKEFVDSKNKKYDIVLSYRNPAPLFQVQGKINAVYFQDLPDQHTITLLNVLFQNGKLNKMIFLSHFQKLAYLQHMPGIEEGRHCLMFENGLDVNLFDSTIEKENEFIYASAPNRGLDVLLDIWPDIHKQLPEYTLKVAGSVNMYNVDSNESELNKQREKFLEIGNKLYDSITDNNKNNKRIEGVKLLGGLNHSALIKELEKSKALLYPSTFAETCCHVLNCALHAGTVPVISSIGAIVEKVGNGENGVIIPGDPKSNEFKKLYSQAVVDLIKSDRVERMIKVNRGSYSAWNMERLVNRLINQLIKFEEYEGNNTRVLGIICSLEDRKNLKKINFKNLIWYAPIDMITDEIAGLPLDQARNAAASMAIYMNADYLLFLDSDIYVDKYFLMNMVKKAEKYNVDVVVTNYSYKDSVSIPSSRVVRVSDNKAINIYDINEQIKLSSKSEEDINNPKKYRFVTSGLGAVLISVNTLKKIGRPYFRTQNVLFKQTGEDSYFYQECSAVGAKIWLATDIPIVHMNEKGEMFGLQEHINLIKKQIGKAELQIKSMENADNKINKHVSANLVNKHISDNQIDNKHISDNQIDNKHIRTNMSNKQIISNNVIEHYQNEYCYKSSMIEGTDSRISNIIKYTNEYIKKGDKIVDLACGDGFIVDTLKNDFDVTKVDIKEGKDIIIHNLELSPYPFEDETFGGVICSEILEHMFKPETLIDESRRILKTNGIMLLTIPNFNSIDNIITRHQILAYNPNNQMSVEHIRHYTIESIIQLLKNKFEIIKVTGNSPNMNPFFNNARKILGKYIKDENVNKNTNENMNNQIFIDMIIGECFPTECMGLMVIARKV